MMLAVVNLASHSFLASVSFELLAFFLQDPLFQASTPHQGTYTQIRVLRGISKTVKRLKEAKAPLNRDANPEIKGFHCQLPLAESQPGHV